MDDETLEMVVGSETIFIIPKKTEIHKLITDWNYFSDYLVQTIEKNKNYMITDNMKEQISIVIEAGNRLRFTIAKMNKKYQDPGRIADTASKFSSYLILTNQPHSVLYDDIKVNEKDYPYGWKDDKFHMQYILMKGPFQKFVMGYFLNYFTAYEPTSSLRLDDSGFLSDGENITLEQIRYHNKIFSEGLECFSFRDKHDVSEAYTKLLTKHIHDLREIPAKYLMELIKEVAFL